MSDTNHIDGADLLVKCAALIDELTLELEQKDAIIASYERDSTSEKRAEIKLAFKTRTGTELADDALDKIVGDERMQDVFDKLAGYHAPESLGTAQRDRSKTASAEAGGDAFTAWLMS